MNQSFDFIGGRLCLDFANAFGGTPPGADGDGYRDLLEWGRQAGFLSEEQTHRLRRRAVRLPGRSLTVVERAGDLAAALRRLFTAIAEGGRASARDLALLNDELSSALGKLAVVGDGGEFELAWPSRGDDLERVLWPVARSAADLLVTADLRRLKACDSPTCTYVFIDASKPGRRRWCDMSVCGNGHKARRHRRRQHT